MALVAMGLQNGASQRQLACRVAHLAMASDLTTQKSRGKGINLLPLSILSLLRKKKTFLLLKSHCFERNLQLLSFFCNFDSVRIEML